MCEHDCENLSMNVPDVQCLYADMYTYILERVSSTVCKHTYERFTNVRERVVCYAHTHIHTHMRRRYMRTRIYVYIATLLYIS